MASHDKGPPRPILDPEKLSRSATGVTIAAHGNDRGTAERHQHDELKRVSTYADNRRGRADRTVDTIGTLLNNGTITLAMAGAGRRFQADFHLAALEQLQAAPLELRPPGGGEGDAVMLARDRIAWVIARMGGHGAPASNALWYVVGCGYSVQQWAQRERLGRGRSLDRYVASGILIGALSALQACYDGDA